MSKPSLDGVNAIQLAVAKYFLPVKITSVIGMRGPLLSRNVNSAPVDAPFKSKNRPLTVAGEPEFIPSIQVTKYEPLTKMGRGKCTPVCAVEIVVRLPSTPASASTICPNRFHV